MAGGLTGHRAAWPGGLAQDEVQVGDEGEYGEVVERCGGEDDLASSWLAARTAEDGDADAFEELAWIQVVGAGEAVDVGSGRLLGYRSDA